MKEMLDKRLSIIRILTVIFSLIEIGFTVWIEYAFNTIPDWPEDANESAWKKYWLIRGWT